MRLKGWRLLKLLRRGLCKGCKNEDLVI
jgi:hypothetical protein